ncbi:MAG: hypothetical protein BGO78_17100 [Chloroflexi bacterium 44-23]|nr:MAG: hypothetical protein BGO78_17100 [Chloroflexi bacterium 44-23]
MKTINSIGSWLLTITLPFILIMFAIRILFTPLFLTFEYNFPGFPADNYGFNKEERLHWGKESMRYLFNRSHESSLSNLRFSDGSTIYNEREISHMVDVKVLLLKSIDVFNVVIIFYALFIFTAFKGNEEYKFWKGIYRGSWLTVGLIAGILIGIAVSFNQLFTLFHKLFFTGDTWLFNLSDTLIRLFPMRLWQDAFIFMGIITLGLAVLLISIGRKRRFPETSIQ